MLRLYRMEGSTALLIFLWRGPWTVGRVALAALQVHRPVGEDLAFVLLEFLKDVGGFRPAAFRERRIACGSHRP